MKPILIALVALAGAVLPLQAAGMPEPSQTDYRQPAALQELVTGKKPAYILLDVRTPEEFAEGHIPTAVNLPYDAISPDRLPTKDRGALVIVYCRSGRRSAVAEETLRSLGFTNLVDFGGINRWQGTLER